MSRLFSSNFDANSLDTNQPGLDGSSISSVDRLVESQLLVEIFAQAPDPILIMNRQDVLIHVNLQALDLLGDELGDLIGTAIGDWIISTDGAPLTATGPAKNWVGLHKDGSRIALTVTTRSLSDGSWVAFVQPQPDELEQSQALRDSELRFRTLADNIAQLAWIADQQGWVFWYNQRWFNYTGMTLEEMQGWGWQKVHHPDYVDHVVARLRHCFETGESWEDTFPLRGQDGTYRWFLSRAIPIRNEQGQVWRWFGTNTDITERKQVETALEERNRHIQLLYETTRDLLSTEQPLALVETIFARLKDLLGLDVYFNYLLDEERQQLHLTFCGGIDEQTAQTIEWLDVGCAVCGMVAQQRRQIAQFDLQHSTDPQAELVRSLGLKAYSCQPLVAQGKLFGTLGFGSRSRSRFTPAELGLFQAICDQIAIALERADLMASLQRQTTELRQANHLKDEFLAALSHELRTPLNPILGWAKLLQGKTLTSTKTAEALEIIERNVRQQISLVDDLLDVSQIIQGNLNLNFRPVDLAFILNGAIETVRIAARAKGITIGIADFAALDPSPLWVMGDSDRLKQIFWNLLSNAVKFTPAGGQICIEVSAVTRETGGSDVRVCVVDDGIGITAAFLPYVFDRFRQADGSSTRQYGGLGLGLSIVRHLVELHGGTVMAASDGVGQGAAFTVQIPLYPEGALLAPPDPPSLMQTGSSPHTVSTSIVIPTLTGTQILLVDDDVDNLDLLRFLLQQNGARVTALTSPIEALQMITDDFPDLIVSDIGMPGMSGYEFIQQVRASLQRPIPALAFTALAQPEVQAEVLAAGFQAHLSKPVDPIQFLAAVQHFSEMGQTPDASADQFNRGR